MTSAHSHIISTIGWQTAFNSREDAAQLQQRLSAWSNFRMPLCVSSMFDKMCPADQVWSINSLEIDLGSIAYNDLEKDLAKKLVDCLQEKINNLIFYAGMQGSQHIEITGKPAVEFGILKTFLLSGMLQWNGTVPGVSLNELFVNQLKHNYGAVLNMVRETGKDEQVRKRLAWQFSSAIVHKIIEALEPVAHPEIFHFASALTCLQQKEHIVQCGIPAFKKNLLLWILTYLLADRGTLFNKQAFMKSSIRQMADHYNVRHQQMLQLIGEAVENMKGSNSTQSNFLKILQNISAESSEIGSTTINISAADDHWKRLELLLSNPSQQRPGSVKKELNTLIAALCRQDPERFSSLLQSVEHTAGWWEKLIGDISIASAELLLAAFNQAGAEAMIQVIDVLNAAATTQAMGIDKKKLLAAGFNFIRAHHGLGLLDKRTCINYFINCISKIKGTTKTKTCEGLVLSNLPLTLKNVSAMRVYKEMLDTCKAFLLPSSAASLQQQKYGLFAEWQHGHSSSRVDDSLDSIKELFHRSVYVHPAGLMRFVLAFPGKKIMEEILLHELTTAEINVLLERSGDQKSRSLWDFFSLLQNANKDVENGMQTLLADTLPRLSVTVMLNYPGLSLKKTIQQLLKKLVYRFDADQLAKLLVILKKLMQDHKQHSIGSPALDGIDLHYLENRYGDRFPVVQRLIRYSGASGRKLLQLISYHPNPAVFNDLYAGNSGAGAALLDRIIKDGSKRMSGLVKKYQALISVNEQREQDAIEKELKELFWRVLLKSSGQNVDASDISRAFESAVAVKYDIKNAASTVGEMAASVNVLTNPLFKLHTDWDINEEALFKLINLSLLQKRKLLKHKGKHYKPAALISFALMKYPSRFRNSILKNGNAKKAIARLRKLVSFDEFSFWIATHLENKYSAAVKELRLLHRFWELLLPAAPVPEEDRFWNVAAEITGENLSSCVLVEKLALAVFEEVRIHPAITLHETATAINRLNLPPGSSLLKCFNSSFPAISLQNNIQTAGDAATLATLQHKGLLNQLVAELITLMQVPSWYRPAALLSAGEMLVALLTHYPHETLLIIRQISLGAKQIEWLINKAGFSLLMAALKKVERTRSLQLEAFEEYYSSLGKLSIQGIAMQTVQMILAGKIIHAWQNNTWRILSAESTWNELMWELATVHGVTEEQFSGAVSQRRALLPASLQAAHVLVFGNAGTTAATNIAKANSFLKRLPFAGSNFNTVSVTGGIVVKNAGIVLLNNYLPLLFERLGIVQHHKFILPEKQEDAVHYLQYLVTGLTQTEEYLLPLNKILCGLSLHSPVKNCIEISTEHKLLMDGLIQAAIGYWPVIGNTSVNGFRGNWLVRDGQLKESGEHWQLLVDKRSYDVLIGKLPFSFSVIKFPWMDKPLKVTWPY